MTDNEELNKCRDEVGNCGKDIVALQTRMENVEKAIEEFKNRMNTQEKLYLDSVVGGEKMGAKIEAVRVMVEQLVSKRVRLVDVMIALLVLFTGAVSAYAAIQSNQLTRVMIEMSKEITTK